MKISKREKLLLILLAFVAIGVVYYQYIYLNQRSILKDLKAQEQEIKLKYDTMIANVSTMEKNNTDIKIFRESIESKSMVLYPELYQDKIILEVNELLNKAGIKGSLSFSEVTVSEVEKYFSEEDTEKAEPTLKETAEEINQLKDGEVSGDKALDNNEVDSRNDSNSIENNEKNHSKSNEETQSQAGTSSEGVLVEQMKVSIAFVGTYANVSNFIQLVSDYGKLVAMPNLSLSASGEDRVSGSIDLEFYSIPKVSEEDRDYLKWTIENTYGKENPFLEGSTGISVSEVRNENEYDLVMSVRAANSDLPSVTFGKSNDSLRDTYIYFDKNEKVDIDIEITEEDGKYYVKYKMPDSSYPVDYDDKGIEINPGEGKIKIAVYSTQRTNVEDKVAVNLNVTSNTRTKFTEITIIDDDKTNPRVNVNVKGNVEYVTN